jgi:hypothetical protein
MTKELNVEVFANAYVAANKEAQKQDATSPEFKGAYQICEELGFVRGSLEWEAGVAGAAAFFFNGHKF